MTLTPIRQHFLIAADAAARLLSDPTVAAHWDEPSALAEFGVRGLAGHLATQLFYVRDVLAAPEPAGDPVGIDDHYRKAAWMNAPLDAEANVSVREAGAAQAADGAVELSRRAVGAAAGLHEALQLALPDRVVLLPWADRRLRLDDFLLTRLMEVSVHSDDLAVSVGVPTPLLPDDVLEPVIQLLTGLALRRHGGLPLLRALSRRERAPETIAAF